MTQNRKTKIIQSLKEGNLIHRSWIGSNRSGRLSYYLEGINLLREKEVEELRKDNIVDVVKGSSSAFMPYKIKICSKAGL